MAEGKGMSREPGTEMQKIIMVNINTGRRMEAWGMHAAARMFHYSVGKVQKFIETGNADPNGWTFDIEEI